jgi:Protein of unknown function (DUF2510)
MSALTTTPIPAGWYPDPHGTLQQRWWNGSSWTQEIAPYKPTLSLIPADPLPKATGSTPNNLPAYNAIAVYGAAQAYTSEPGYSGAASTISAVAPAVDEWGIPAIPYQPFAMIPKLKTGVSIAPTQRYTAAIWGFVVTPLLLAFVTLGLSFGPSTLYTRFSLVSLIVLAVAALIALAIRDRRELSIDGHTSTASPAWLILTPIGYLVARAIIVRKQTGKSATAPLILSIFVVIAVIAWALLQPTSLAQVLAAAPL